MPAEWIKLLFSAESLLMILIAIYLVIAIGVGSYRLRKYLQEHPNEKEGKEYSFQNETSALTLAGFSLTALALLISIRYNDLNSISSTLQFFSLAFLFLILSPTFIKFRIANFFVYIADVFMNAGLLSIACGFLVFFGETVSWANWSTVIFSVLVVALFLASLINYILVESVVESKNDGKNGSKYSFFWSD
jgi:hypothetical protein